jgi:hypothetical protein
MDFSWKKLDEVGFFLAIAAFITLDFLALRALWYRMSHEVASMQARLINRSAFFNVCFCWVKSVDLSVQIQKSKHQGFA